MAFGIEATKNCSLPQAIGYLTMAVKVMLERAGIVAETLPSVSQGVIAEELRRNEEFSGLRVKINDYERLIQPKILLAPGDQFQILSVEAEHSHGWYPSLSSSHFSNGIGKVFSITRSDQVTLQKYEKKVAIFHILMKDAVPFQREGNHL